MVLSKMPRHYQRLCGEIDEDDYREFCNQMFFLGIDLDVMSEPRRFSRRVFDSKRKMSTVASQLQSVCLSIFLLNPILDDVAEEDHIETLVNRICTRVNACEYSTTLDRLEDGDAFSQIWEHALAVVVRQCLSQLKPKEENVIRLRFGIDCGHEHTLEEIGDQFYLTRERIRQIEAKALRELHYPRCKDMLRPYVFADPKNYAKRKQSEKQIPSTETPIAKPSRGASIPFLETKVRNACLFTSEEESILSCVFGWFGNMPMTIQEYAQAHPGQGKEIEELHAKALKLIYRLRLMKIWNEAELPEAWQIRSKDMSKEEEEEIVVEPIDLDRELPPWEYQIDYLHHLTQGKPFTTKTLRVAQKRPDWPFAPNSIYNLLGFGGMYSQGFRFVRYGKRGSTIYVWRTARHAKKC